MYETHPPVGMVLDEEFLARIGGENVKKRLNNKKHSPILSCFTLRSKARRTCYLCTLIIRYYYWHVIVMVKRDFIKIMAMIVVVVFPRPS